MKNEPYHYTESGLDYVWLANGFTRHATPRLMVLEYQSPPRTSYTK